MASAFDKFDIQYVSQKSIKGRIIIDHLASVLIPDSRIVNDDFPDEEIVAMTSLSNWCMNFDGVANHCGYGIGPLFVSPPYWSHLEVCLFGIFWSTSYHEQHCWVWGFHSYFRNHTRA